MNRHCTIRERQWYILLAGSTSPHMYFKSIYCFSQSPQPKNILADIVVFTQGEHLVMCIQCWKHLSSDILKVHDFKENNMKLNYMKLQVPTVWPKKWLGMRVNLILFKGWSREGKGGVPCWFYFFFPLLFNNMKAEWMKGSIWFGTTLLILIMKVFILLPQFKNLINFILF